MGLLEELTSASSTLSVFGSYSGATALKSVYASPDLAKERFGKVVARIGPTVWKLGRYNRDHVSNKMPAVTELTLGLQKQTSLSERTGQRRHLSEPAGVRSTAASGSPHLSPAGALTCVTPSH